MPLLSYESPQPPPPRWRRLLYPFRFALLSLYAILLAAAIACWIWMDLELLPVVIGLLVLLGLQALFLLGCPQLRWPRPTRRRHILLSVAAGAAVAALLTFGLLATALNLFNRWSDVTNALEEHIFWGIAIAWIAWFVLFLFMYLGRWITGFKTLYKTLIAGTWLEILITIPIDIHVRRQTRCYCGEGTFFALVIGTSMALWSFGPGLVLLFLTRKLQRDGYFNKTTPNPADPV